MGGPDNPHVNKEHNERPGADNLSDAGGSPIYRGDGCHSALSAIRRAAAPLVRVRNLTLTVPSAAGPVNILRGIDLDIGRGEAVGLVGPSGSGKTSLLMVLAGLERVTSGSILLDGREITGLDEDALAGLRRAADRHRLPGLPPDPDHDGAGECRGAAGTGRRRNA